MTAANMRVQADQAGFIFAFMNIQICVSIDVID